VADRCFARTRKASVDEGDDINNYDAVLKKHINRMQVAEKVIAGQFTIRFLARRWPCMPWLQIQMGRTEPSLCWSLRKIVLLARNSVRVRSLSALLTSVRNVADLRPKMTEFHGKVGGDLAKIEALFTDMAPEPQKVIPPAPTHTREGAWRLKWMGRHVIVSFFPKSEGKAQKKSASL
jgi:hypothetical protein